MSSLSRLAKVGYQGGAIKFESGGDRVRFYWSDKARDDIIAATGVPDIAFELPCRYSVDINKTGEGSFAPDDRFRPTPRTYQIQVYPFAGDWVRLPYQLPPKLGNGKSSSDELVDLFDEIAVACGAAIKRTPPEFCAHKISAHHYGKDGHGCIHKVMRKKNWYFRVSADVGLAVYGGQWPVPYRATCHMWLHTKGAGVTRIGGLNVYLSKDGKEWTRPVWEVEGQHGAEGKAKCRDYVKACRAKYEAETRRP